MYEDQTYEEILRRTLARIPTDVDKREGSVVMNAVAPVSAEHANIFILLNSIIQNGYADTAEREYLVKRCEERGIFPYEATHAVLKGKFNMEIPLSSRFSLNSLNDRAISFIESLDGTYYYQMECETLGTEGNKYFGALSSIEYISKDLEGELVALLIPAEDEEATEDLRDRYYSSLKSSAFGGNRKDYVEKTDSIAGVGGTVVVPVWNGGGTVKLVIIDSEFSVASDVLVAEVQNAVDPLQDGSGTGFAPIGHTVTVETAKAVPITISTSIFFNEGYTWEAIRELACSAIEEYLLTLRKSWENGAVTVRISQIENRLLSVDGVVDIVGTTVNGGTDNIVLEYDEIPVLGGIVNG